MLISINGDKIFELGDRGKDALKFCLVEDHLKPDLQESVLNELSHPFATIESYSFYSSLT